LNAVYFLPEKIYTKSAMGSYYYMKIGRVQWFDPFDKLRADKLTTGCYLRSE